MTNDESERLNEVCAEAQALRSLVAALVSMSPEPQELRAAIEQQIEATTAMLLGELTTQSYIDLVERKSRTYLELLA